MGRKRDKPDALPKYVYLRGGSYKLRYPVGTYDDGRSKFRQESFGSDLYACLQRRAELFSSPGVPRMVGDLIDAYVASEWFTRLRSTTKKDYLKQLNIVRKSLVGPIKLVEPHHIAALRTKRGEAGKRQANYLLSVLKVLFEFGRECGARSDNPAKGVRAYALKARDRYVTDEEFSRVFEIAPPAVQVAMTLSAITGIDQKTVLSLRFDQFTADGLVITRSKTGKAQIFEWSDMLRWCHDFAREIRPRVRGIVVCRRDGKPYSGDGFRSIWQRLQTKAAKTGMERYTFHDLRAKAGSDSEDWRLLGHSSRALFERVYNRLPQRAKPTK